MFRFSFFFFILAMLIHAPSYAAVTCEPKPMGAINIVWDSDNIQYDFTKSQSQMNRMEIDTENPYGRNVETHVGGLMKGGIAIQSRIQVAKVTYPRSRETCQWIDNMQVSLRISPKIYIARDHRQGSCKHKAILEHEMKHVFVDREIVKKYIPIFKRDLENAVRKVGIVGPKPERDARKYQQKINDYMEKQLKAVSDKLYAERSANQQGVDTLEEYERVAALCR